MAAGHAELIGEMTALEKLSMPERLKHAKKRRAQQLKAYGQYEKQLNKEISKKAKKVQGSGTHPVPLRAAARLRFDPSILLLEATMRNDVEEVNNLLNAGVDPNVSNEDGLRALHQCSIDNLDEIMKLLIQCGANVNVCDTELWTPLHAAATCGHLSACRYLVEHGAELLTVNSDGNMPYDLCEEPDTLDYIESEMAKRGVTQEMIDDIRLSSENKMLSDLKQLHENGGNLEYVGNNGETPLHVAACNGYVYVTEFLLVHHVAVSVPDDDGWTPLHCAACWGQLQVVELLLQHGADYEARTKGGETTLDLCEDIEMKQRVLEIVEEIENKQAYKSRDSAVRRRNSAARKGSTATAHAMRRTNPHEKSSIAHIEAQEEAIRLRESINSADNDDEDDDDDDENFVILDAISVPQPTEADDIDLDLVDEAVVAPTKSTEQKPIKSIISKSSQGRNLQVQSSVPLPTDIWLNHDGLEASPVKGLPDAKDNKKDNKKGNKKGSKAGDKSENIPEPSDMAKGNKSSASSTTSSKTINTPNPADNELTKPVPNNDMPKTGKTNVPSSDGTKNGKAQKMGKSGSVSTSVEGKNVSREEVPLTDIRNSKGTDLSPRASGISADKNATASGLKTSSDLSQTHHQADGNTGAYPPTGTLADLKKQRAKRLQDTLASVSAKENGKAVTVEESSSVPNGTPINSNDHNVNKTTAHLKESSFRGEKPQRRYINAAEVVDGNDRRCCIIL